MSREKKPTVLFMSTYPPRQCGIATFTKDLTSAIKGNSPNFQSRIIALDNESSESMNYSGDVSFRIRDDVIADYIRIAKKINKDKSIKLVNIHHTFGLYGGWLLNYLSAFLETLEKPVVMTLHSVVPDPPKITRSIIRYLAAKIDCIFVMADVAVEILQKDYGIKTRMEVIPHGIHEVDYEPSSIQKKHLGLDKKIILSSFGLINGGKKYEDIIQALPSVVRDHPNVEYLIMGATHPGILRDEGEKYRNRLKRLIKRLNLEKNVKFVNKYMELDELLDYLKATDIFVSSGRGLTQITSGTLIYAMGCGCPVITIPFLHAKEAVTPDRGILVELGSPESFSAAIRKLVEDASLRESMGRNAYEYARKMTWPNIAKTYENIFDEIIASDAGKD